MTPIDPSAVVAEARRWLGTPYQHQASLCGVGTDCLGLVRGIWRALLGPEPVTPPGYSRDWAECDGAEPLLDAASRHLIPVAMAELTPGHVIIFRYRTAAAAKHAAVLVTDATMIHAAEGASVAEVAFTPWWRRHAVAAFAFPARTSVEI